MDDKRYQVFVSSTYEDLREERSAAILALLKLNCFPAGMELFPSSDDTVWEIIQQTIRESDYYVLIIAGRYGSISNDGETSWTEREYDYAQKLKKPTFVFFYKELGEIKSKDIDDMKKVAEFREKVKGRMLRTCRSIDNLQTEITVAIATAKSSTHAAGWIRADTVHTTKNTFLPKPSSITLVTETNSEIIETGENANGHFIKYKDGTLICFKHFPHGLKISNDYKNYSCSFCYPAAFIDLPIIHFEGIDRPKVKNVTTSSFAIESEQIINEAFEIRIKGRWKDAKHAS